MSIIPDNAPLFKTLDKIDFLPVETHQLDNGVPVSVLRAGSQEVTKIDIEFPAGAIQAGMPLIASTTANLMQEGTVNKTSMQIAEIIDFYGAYLTTQTFHHNTTISFLCLTNYLPQMLELVHEIITRPLFPRHEYDIYLQKKREEFIIEGEKVKTIATRQFSQSLFGANHPYGRQLQEEHFQKITPEQVKSFHEEHYRPELATIYVAGQPGPDFIQMVNHYFGTTKMAPERQDDTVPLLSTSTERIKVIPKKGAMQSAVRIGRPLFNNHHPDFIPLQVLNTILGGYFGSRLMTSVREEKGLTYGIGSYIMPLRHSGIWGISSEVAGESRDDAIDAIFEEFEILRTREMPEEELRMVKNYMMGDLLRNFDGPFSTADIYRSLQEFNMDFTFYQKMIDHIKEVTTRDILELSRKYLRSEDFLVVVAGV